MPGWRILLRNEQKPAGKRRRGQGAAVIGMTLFLACVFSLCVGVGSVVIMPAESLRIIWGKLTGTGDISDLDPSLVSILWDIRMPRVAMAFLSGGALSLSGAVMQTILQNPLASSYTLGVSSGASLGAAIVIASGISLPVLGTFLLPVTAFFMGFLVIAVVLVISSRISSSLQTHTVILMGMSVSLFVNALLTLLSSFAGNRLQQLILWQMGSFSGMRWYHVEILTPICFSGLLLLVLHSRELDILSFGDENALSLGVSVKKGKFFALVLSTLLTGAVVCFTGTIGFVDLVAPHAVRRVFGTENQKVLPLSFLFGGAFLALCDMLSRSLLAPREIPGGAVTAMAGTPFFLWLYVEGGKNWENEIRACRGGHGSGLRSPES